MTDTMDEAWKLADDHASEHVQILTKYPREALEKMTNHGTNIPRRENLCFLQR